MTAEETIIALAKAFAAEGGRALCVGGSVRDGLLGVEANDFDVEVFGLTPERVEEIVKTFGEVSDVGKAFAILKLVVDGVDIDIAVPRREQKAGEGHGGFVVEADPHLDPKEASRRRDFTINAIAQDPLTGEIIDPFGGVADVKAKVLRVVDAATFGEDPLRVLRAMQLIGRFYLHVDEESFDVMQKMSSALTEISPERIGMEWRKLLTMSEKPSWGMDFGMKVGAFEVLHPELTALERTPQEPEWHPEGNVWIHTMMVVDEAARIVRREKLDDVRAVTLLFGALCHDFGKPYVTAVENGRIRSHGHEEAGEVPTRSFLEALYIDGDTIDRVVGIVKDHMKPYRLWHAECVDEKPVTDGTIRRLAARIHPANFCDLVLVTESDYCGRGPFFDSNDPSKSLFRTDYPAGQWLLDRAAKINVLHGPAPHIITGDELIDLGFAPNPLFGDIIRMCDDLRDEADYSHYAIVELLRHVSPDAFGERDVKAAAVKLRAEAFLA